MSKPVWNDRHQINKQVAGKNKGSHGPPPSKPLPLPPPSKDMPWLNRRAKSEIDNAPPFSHRGSSGSRPSSKSSSTRPCSMDAKSSPPPPSNPRSLSKSTHHSTNSMPVPSASEQLDIRRLATQHLERHYNSMQNVKESRPPQRPKPMPPPLPLSARYKPPPPSFPPSYYAEAKGNDNDNDNNNNNNNDNTDRKGGDSSRKGGDSSDLDSGSSSLSSEFAMNDLDLELDINAINEEDNISKNISAHNTSFHISEDVLHVGGFEIGKAGISRGGGGGGGEQIFTKMKAGGGAGGLGGQSAMDSLISLAVLGRGASGVVRKALHVPTLTLVAQKQISVFEVEKRHQMVRELKALYNNLVPLTPAPNNAQPATKTQSQGSIPCPHIVSMYDAYMDKKEQSVTLVVEYMDGGSLQDIVDTGGCDCEPVLANISARVLAGLAFLHKNKQIHRDIKPANLLINHHGNVKISDLGIVRDLAGEGTNAAETFTGTFSYMSPERIGGEKYSFTCDIWR